MCTAIAECHRIDEVKDLRDKAKALEVYAHQAQNFDAERKACEIRIRAERRAGELLREMKETGTRQTAGTSGPTDGRGARLTVATTPPTLSDLGITRDQSSKWQQLAAVPKEEFERAMNAEGSKPTTEGIVNHATLVTDPPQKMDADTLWLWGRLREFETRGLFDKAPSDLTSQMTDSMREDCSRLIPPLRIWLAGMDIADSRWAPPKDRHSTRRSEEHALAEPKTECVHGILSRRKRAERGRAQAEHPMCRRNRIVPRSRILPLWVSPIPRLPSALVQMASPNRHYENTFGANST